jgi:hypothetical protein
MIRIEKLGVVNYCNTTTFGFADLFVCESCSVSPLIWIRYSRHSDTTVEGDTQPSIAETLALRHPCEAHRAAQAA